MRVEVHRSFESCVLKANKLAISISCKCFCWWTEFPFLPCRALTAIYTEADIWTSANIPAKVQGVFYSGTHLMWHWGVSRNAEPHLTSGISLNIVIYLYRKSAQGRQHYTTISKQYKPWVRLNLSSLQASKQELAHHMYWCSTACRSQM